MYKIATVEDMVRVPPKRFGEDLDEVIKSELNDTIAGRIDKTVGIIIAVTEVKEHKEGKIILGDGGIYYEVVFDVLVFQPAVHEVVDAIVKELTEFGAFVNFGPMDGLIHISQIAESFMNYDGKNKMFVDKESSRTMKEGDVVRARIVTVSIKDRVSTSKVGLTMRQPYLGKLEWLEKDKEKAAGKPAKEKDDRKDKKHKEAKK
ncbi:MAG: DNA-directed RNA polymerase [Candidatus Altiarchaeota archaeon]|nr:DNA-directed RNA polymerase [Candidatus Altiarchaeota archaeon]